MLTENCTYEIIILPYYRRAKSYFFHAKVTINWEMGGYFTFGGNFCTCRVGELETSNWWVSILASMECSYDTRYVNLSFIPWPLDKGFHSQVMEKRPLSFWRQEGKRKKKKEQRKVNLESPDVNQAIFGARHITPFNTLKKIPC